MRSTIQAALLLFVISIAGRTARAESNWPQWRGPLGTGHSSNNAPTTWTNDDVVWRTELPGRGQSSPVIWGDRIFLTSASEDGRERMVLCVDRPTGKIRWQKSVGTTANPEQLHKMNTFASATCATDGELVVAFFGRGGIYGLDIDGNVLWSRELGQFEGPWGTGASPILVGDLVIQNCDAEDDAYLLALDKKTGETRWQTPRPKLRGWSTPVLVDVGGARQLVLNGEPGVDAYDPATGNHLWFSRGDSGRGTPTVVPYQDLIIAVSGRPGDMWATKVGGNGRKSDEVWRTKRTGGRDLPSPIVVGDYLIVFKLQPGIVTCYEAATGQQLSQLRLENNFSASPIAVNGLVYMTNEAGETYVIRPGKQMELVAKNTLEISDEEVFRASLAAVDGQLFCRSDRVLYCIGRPASLSGSGE